jgi:hypothetical protein
MELLLRIRRIVITRQMLWQLNVMEDHPDMGMERVHLIHLVISRITRKGP